MIKKKLDGLIDILKIIGACSIAAMMVLTCADVIMRGFGHPISGAVEISGFLATVALACSMPFTHAAKGHVGVDMLTRRLSPRTQGIIDFKTGIFGLIIFLAISWQSFKYASALKKSGELSMTLEFPSYVFVYFISLAFAILCMVVLFDIIHSFGKAIGK